MSDLKTKMSANKAFVFELSQTRSFVHIIYVGLEIYKKFPLNRFQQKHLVLRTSLCCFSCSILYIKAHEGFLFFANKQNLQLWFSDNSKSKGLAAIILP